MHVAFNSKERTLREMMDIALSGGWRITEVLREPEGSLFCTIVAIPTPVLPSKVLGRARGQSRESEGTGDGEVVGP